MTPRTARRLLRESGVADPKLRFITFQGNNWSGRLGELFQAQLQAVGFDVSLRAVDRALSPAVGNGIASS